MADTKVSDLTELGVGPAETDELYLNDGGTSKKITAVELLNPEKFTAVALPAATDEIFINDGGTGKKITHDDLLFGANGTPSTQAHSDSAAIGTALDAARSDHKHAMPAAGGGGGAFAREGGQTTEATSTSGSAVDLLTATGLSIAATEPFLILAPLRKTDSVADHAGFGLKLDSTVTGEASISVTNLGRSQQAADEYTGMAAVWVGPRVTNYLGNAVGETFLPNGVDSALGSVGTFVQITNLFPTGQVDDVIIRTITASSAVGAADELHVYSADDGV